VYLKAVNAYGRVDMPFKAKKTKLIQLLRQKKSLHNCTYQQIILCSEVHASRTGQVENLVVEGRELAAAHKKVPPIERES